MRVRHASSHQLHTRPLSFFKLAPIPSGPASSSFCTLASASPDTDISASVSSHARRPIVSVCCEGQIRRRSLPCTPFYKFQQLVISAFIDIDRDYGQATHVLICLPVRSVIKSVSVFESTFHDSNLWEGATGRKCVVVRECQLSLLISPMRRHAFAFVTLNLIQILLYRCCYTTIGL